MGALLIMAVPAEDMFIYEMLRVVKELTPENVKDLEFSFGTLGNLPWTKSPDGDALFLFEQMKQRMMWLFDSRSKKYNFTELAKYMKWIERKDLEHRLHCLGKTRSASMLLFISFQVILILQPDQ